MKMIIALLLFAAYALGNAIADANEHKLTYNETARALKGKMFITSNH